MNFDISNNNTNKYDYKIEVKKQDPELQNFNLLKESYLDNKSKYTLSSEKFKHFITDDKYKFTNIKSFIDHIKNFNIDDDGTINTFIPFSQEELIDEQKLPKDLNKFVLKYDGLCDLVCNRVLIDNLLGKDDRDVLKKEITVENLNKDYIKNSHLLDVFSFFQKMVSFLFGIYPDNIFSTTEQRRLVKNKRINEKILFEGLEKIEPGTTLKVEVFKKNLTSFYGHSLLVKKTEKNEFIFFDPNTGEYRGLSQQD
ncbi:MAG: hypothetical protein WD607_00685, partial [Candidatus Paceibacterota bacterium]